MSPCLLFARMICGLQGARMCLSAESQQARVPSSIRKPNALSLFPAVFEPRSEGSVLAHTAPVNQVQGQSPFEWSVVLIMQPPFCPLLPSLHLLHPPAPPPQPTTLPNHYSPLGFLSPRATQLLGTKRPKGGQFGNMSPEGPYCRMGLGGVT